MQLTHYNSNFSNKKFPIVLICDNVTNAPNIGSLFRISDAFGVEKLILCGENISLGRKVSKTSRATEKSVDFLLNKNISEIVNKYKQRDFQIIALEITSSSKAIHTIKFSKNKPIALIVGDENFGISEDILNLSDQILHIEMFGLNSSMNVVQATNIALYEITKQIM